jgi:hypothetical protein
MEPFIVNPSTGACTVSHTAAGYTQANDALLACAQTLRAYDSNRWVAWWYFSNTDTGTGPGAMVPKLLIDSHVATYTSSTSCATDAAMLAAVNLAAKGWGLSPGIMGEINAQISLCNPVSTYLIQQLVTTGGVPYVCWGYKENEAQWNAVLGAVSSNPMVGMADYSKAQEMVRRVKLSPIACFH